MLPAPHFFHVLLAAILAAAALSPIIVAMIGAVALIFAPLGAYLVARRQFSGKIETTEARELWKESRSIREWSSRRIAELEESNRGFEERIQHLEDENRELRARLLGTLPAA